jgi:MarR family transcriptional regulator, organic hydroperoxide resistance regulator
MPRCLMVRDRRLFFLLHRAHRAVMAHANAGSLEELGISSAQLATLSYVAKHEGCSMTDIANLLDLNKSAVSSMVQRLERAGILRREPNPKDGRGSLLFVTPKGEAVRLRSLPVIRRLTAEITEGFDEREVETILRFLSSAVDRYANEEHA